MKNSQKLVFTMLVAVLLLEFGSLSKAKTLWTLAFSKNAPPPGGEIPESPAPGPPGGEIPENSLPLAPTTHPVVQL